MNILFYPVFHDSKSLTDHYYRLHWYLYPFKNKISKITLLHTINHDPIGDIPYYLDKQLIQLVKHFSNVQLKNTNNVTAIIETVRNADYIFLWSSEDGKSDEFQDSEFSDLIKNKTIIKIDHNRERSAGSFYLYFAQNFSDDTQEAILHSKETFEHIAKRCRNQVGYIFGTGPGLAYANHYDFSDGVSIACNSMVKNQSLLERLKPPLIVVADPIFHAGCSTYAAAFRRKLINAMDRYNSYLIVPMRDFHIYVNHLPKRFRNRIAAIPFNNADQPNLNIKKLFNVTTTSNVLTLFLIPLACTFFNEIRIFGCDGRPLEDNSYFWKHHKSSQFNAEMDDIKMAHPAFFDIDYDDYYLTHINILEKWLTAAEHKGKKIINMSPSYIPALQNRSGCAITSPGSLNKTSLQQKTNSSYILNNDNTTSTTLNIKEIIILDLDAIDHFGHFLAYNDRLHEACLNDKIDFTIFGNVNCSDDITKSRSHFKRLFTLHSWTIGNCPNGPKDQDIIRFKEELKKGLQSYKQKDGSQKTVIYMYCGSLPAAKAIEDVLKDFNNIFAVICLFWLSFTNYKSSSYVAQWQYFLTKSIKEKKIFLVVPTKQLADGIKEAFDINLPIIPHPSTTFSDSDAIKLINEHDNYRKIYKNKKFTVLFPGGMRPEKGFNITVSSAMQLADKYPHKFHCIVRAYITKSTPKEMINLVEKLKNRNVTLHNAHMDNEEFIKFLKSADIIVLPYQDTAFKDRTSGLLIDALYLGVPVVVWDKTWLANIVSQYKNGIIIKKEEGIDFFIKSLTEIANQFNILLASTREAQVNYFKSNSWAQLLNFLKACFKTTVKKNTIEQKKCHKNNLMALPRHQKATVDETHCIAELYKSSLTGNLMMDIGAHHGSSLAPFKRMGWKIFAFEPDPKNREYLLKHHGKDQNVIIDPRAVGEKVEKARAFYGSEESTGISGMLDFRDTHRQIATVAVTTVGEIIKEHGIDHIDFLKIDVEGYDYAVLKGVPWDKVKPDVIECEFEDEKTKLLGHSWRDICDYLVNRGYSVYVSEWHPIIRYGIRHDWLGLKKYPCKLESDKAWGNLLAFIKDPGWDVLKTAVNKVLKVGNPTPSSRLAMVPESDLNIRTANNHFRERKYSQAISIYLALYEKNGLSMYANNALMAAKKMNIPNINNIKDLQNHYLINSN